MNEKKSNFFSTQPQKHPVNGASQEDDTKEQIFSPSIAHPHTAEEIIKWKAEEKANQRLQDENAKADRHWKEKIEQGRHPLSSKKEAIKRFNPVIRSNSISQNQKGRMWTLWHDYAQGRIDQLANALIAQAQEINTQDFMGHTPLHIAAAWSSADIVSVLLKNNADANIIDDTMQTPLDFARAAENEVVIKLLLSVTAEKLRQVYEKEPDNLARKHCVFFPGSVTTARPIGIQTRVADIERRLNAQEEKFNSVVAFFKTAKKVEQGDEISFRFNKTDFNNLTEKVTECKMQ